MGFADAAPKVGSIADLMLTPSATIREAIASAPPRTLVIRHGHVSFSRLAQPKR
jgi:hypothetical protein